MSIYPDIRAGQRMQVDVLRSMVYDEVVKATTETITSSTTFQDDDELFMTGVANATYRFDLMLLHSSGTTGRFKCRFTAPAGATVAWSVIGVEITITSSTNVANVIMPSRVVGDILGLGGGNLAGTTAHISGVFTTSSTAGDLTFQWAQNVSDAAATQVRAGSALRMKRIA